MSSGGPRRVIGAFSLFVALSSRAQGQQTLADSADRLNAAGQWDAVLNLVRTRLPAAPVDEACQLRLARMRSLARLRRYDEASREQANYAASCSAVVLSAVRSHAKTELAEELALPTLPTGGVDFSAIDFFWQVVDTLTADHEPSETLWRTMFVTPGYRLSFTNVQPLRANLELAFRPSLVAARDSILRTGGDRTLQIQHLRRALSDRAGMTRLADSLRRNFRADTAVRLAARLLPAAVSGMREAPLVTFAIFRPDAYGTSRGVVLDLGFAATRDIVPVLAHEFHHAFVSSVDEGAAPASDEPDFLLYSALYNLRNEGIADLLDKSYPLITGSASPSYVERYNREYESSDRTLSAIDALLAGADGDRSKLPSTGQHIRDLLWSGGHPVGARMAREIMDRFGADSIIAATASPFRFLRVYDAARTAHAMPPLFQGGSWALLRDLESAARSRKVRVSRPSR
jgi:hypothetical protein